MGNYSNLKNAIKQVIKENGNQEITGDVLQTTLLSMVSNIGEYGTFLGVAVPSTNPGIIDQNGFYLATKRGVYVNFNNYEVTNNMVIFENSTGVFIPIETNVGINSNNVMSTLFDVSQTLSLANLDTSNPPATPAIGTTWDWQNAFVKSNGTLTYNADEIQTRLIATLPGKFYFYSGYINGDANIAFYDSNANFIGGISPTIGIAINTWLFQIPTGVSYFSVNCKRTFIIGGIFQLLEVQTVIPYIPKYNTNDNGKILSIENGVTKWINSVDVTNANKATELLLHQNLTLQNAIIYKKENPIIDTTNPPLTPTDDDLWDMQLGWMDNKGIITYVTNEVVTNFIKISPNATKIKYNGYLSGMSSICFYDKNKVLLQGLNAAETGTTPLFEYIFNIPLGTYYIRATTLRTNASIFNLLYLEDGFITDGDRLFSYLESEKILFDSKDVGSIIKLANLDKSNPPATPAIGTTWDWQNAYVNCNSGLVFYNTNEIQTRLIKVQSKAAYKYNGRFQGTAGIAMYNVDGIFVKGITGTSITGGSTIPVYEYEFVIPDGVEYISINCFKNVIASSFKLVQLLSVDIQTNNNEDLYFNGFLKELLNTKIIRLSNNYQFNIPNNYVNIAVNQTINKNVNNENGTLSLLQLVGNKTLDIRLTYSPASNVLLPQKENTDRETDIFYPDFPMCIMQTKLGIYIDNVLQNEITLSGNPYRNFLRTVPSMTIRYIPDSGVDLSTKENLRLYITQTNGICDLLQIKDGDTVIYSYTIDQTRDITFIYRDLRDALKSINGYSFEVVFADIDNMTVADLVATKLNGLGFVTKYSDNTKTTGNMIYDTYPVFIEAHDKFPIELSISIQNNSVSIYLDGIFLNTITTISQINKCNCGYTGVEIINASLQPWYSNNSNVPVIKGYTGHEFSTEPSVPSYSDMEGTGTAVGCVTYLKRQAENRGFINVSAEDVAMYMMRRKKLPAKCYYIEMDDLGQRQKVNDLLSDKPEYLRQMEIIKMNGIKLGFAMAFGGDSELFLKIKNGTATDEEKQQLSTVLTNKEVIRLRGLMKTYGWSVAVHEFVYPVQFVTATKFDDFVAAIRNTIDWYERMFEKTPITYVTSLTGNSSPYFRRLFPMYGIPVVFQDNLNVYSIGRFHSFVNRDGFYYRTIPSDKDF